MDKFSFGAYNSANTDVVFNDPSYVDPASESETRKQFSYPLYEIKKYLREVCNITSNDDVIQLKMDFISNSLKYSSDGTTWNDITFYGQAGKGLPAGGSVGQIIRKKSVYDYDTEWTDLSVDQTYNSASANPQSGVAVADAISTKVNLTGTQTFNIEGTTFELKDGDDNTVQFTVEVV